MSESRDQNRIHPVDPDQATGGIGQLLAEIRPEFALGAESVSHSGDCAGGAELTEHDLARARAVGLGDGEIVETVANVARVPIDFPQSQSRETSEQGGESNG
jgi:hypothetical protein